MSDVPTPDEIINGGKKPSAQKLVMLVDQSGTPLPLTPNQAKALGIILGGAAYVLIGMKPTLGDKGNPGADFFTVLDGDKEHLRDAKGALGDIIDRAYSRNGIV